MHNDVDDLIESDLNSKLLLINLKSQRLNKKKQEVKNIIEQSTKRGTRISKSLQNFRVKKSSTSLNNTSQISLVHAIALVLPTEEPEYSLSIGDDELLSYENVSMEDFKVYSNPLFDNEEINFDEIDSHYFNTESDFIESLPNRDTLFDYSPKFDYLEEFFGILMPTSIVDEERINREHEEYISPMEKLLAINSFPLPLENFHTNTIIETLPSSIIPVEDSDSLREEIDIFTGTDDLLPPGIENNDYDSEGDIHFLKELLVNNSISLPRNESSNFDHHDDWFDPFCTLF
nr:hypothetical protein [Tanacetum cinerariifolium]